MIPFQLIKKFYLSLRYRFWDGPRGKGKPVPASALDHEYRSGAWDHFWEEDETYRHLLLVEMIKERDSPLSLLDLGCGSGRLASMLGPELVHTYLGVDLSEEGLAKARSLIPGKTFLHGNYEIWRPGQKYDVITFNECLGYAVVPAETIEVFLKFLNPGGCIIVSHFRWGNHDAIWRSLEKVSRSGKVREARNTRNQIWDLKVLLPLKA